MLNEYAYCPRLFHLMHVEGRWADNLYTDEGRWAHRRVDAAEQTLPETDPPEAERADAEGTVGPSSAEGEGDTEPTICRSVTLGCPRLGLIAKLDLVEIGAGVSVPPVDVHDLTGISTPMPGAPVAVPVETKRGRVPTNAERSWEPERVQLMAQGLLLRAHGYACDRGVLYFQASRTRVDVHFTAELETRTVLLAIQAREAARAEMLPPPLVDSPKCPGCSLCGICLPDETHALQLVPEDPAAPTVRRLYPPRDDSQPLYVQEQGAFVGKRGESLQVSKAGERLSSARLKDISQVVLCGNVTVSPPALHLLAEAGVPVVHLSSGHWFYGLTAGFTLRNGFDRAAQFRAADDPARRLVFAKAFVAAKGQNQRTLLRRNADPPPPGALERMASLIRQVDEVAGADQLLGIEGGIAAAYFAGFPAMLRPRAGEELLTFDFATRNRRPPRDPVNALLSFGYAMLAKECSVALAACGLDPFWGFYHRPRHGRPGLALDLMEEFRPLVVDSAVLSAVNTGMVTMKDFIAGPNACALTPTGRKAFLRAYEARLDQLATHPVFGYRCSWRRLIAMQAQVLARVLRGDIPAYIGVVTR
jgi:CRISPR-associated protein Cas1